MKVIVTFKVNAEQDWLHSRHCDMEPAEFHLLQTDFLDYLNEKEGALKGASYKYFDSDSKQSRTMVLRFEDILHIEGTVHDTQADSRIQQDVPLLDDAASDQAMTGPLESAGAPEDIWTSPLLTRLTGSSPTAD